MGWARMMMPLRRLDRKGGAATELALVSPVILTLMIGLADYGMAMSATSSLRSAARAGAQYAIGNPADDAGIRAAVLAATDADPSLLSVTVAQSCQCPGSGGGNVSCGGTCAGGSTPALYVDVKVSRPVASAIPVTSPLFPQTIAGEAVVRVQ
jgi:Flp pilus assembly protein TadG